MKPTPADLEHAVDTAVKECKALGYNPARFCIMRSQDGTVETICRLLARPTVSDGFIKLMEMGRLDLTVEAIALRFPDFFSEAKLDLCRDRLQGHEAREERARSPVPPVVLG
jgi:hypothetical protein